MKIYLIGVGPGDPDYITERARKIIKSADIIVGYRHTINIIKDLILNKDVRYVTLKTQEEIYSNVLKEIKDSEKICVIPFTGDSCFSESEIVDRLREIFCDKNIIIEPGISSIQIAAARAKVALDKCKIITFHITGNINKEKEELIYALKKKKTVIILPRPWDFMPKHIVEFLKDNKIDLKEFDAEIYECLTHNEEITYARLDEIPEKEYSDLIVIVIKPR